jgi:hypothetical protein
MAARAPPPSSGRLEPPGRLGEHLVHLNGPIAAALGQAAPDLLAKDPDIQTTGILAAK